MSTISVDEYPNTLENAPNLRRWIKSVTWSAVLLNSEKEFSTEKDRKGFRAM